MARHAEYPPKIQVKNGYERCWALGSWHHLGPAGSERSKAAYEALLARVRAKGEAPPPLTLADLRVRDVAARFLTHAEAAYSERGREVPQFGRAIAALLARHGNTPARAFGPKALRDVQLAMTRPPFGWCRNRVNRQVVRLRTMWRWAESEELVPAGSTAALRTLRGLARNAPGVRNTPRRAPTPWEDLQKVLPFCPAAVAVMLQLQWWSGCRSQDVRLIRADRIDASGEAWLYFPEVDKGDWREGAEEAPRVVFLGAECQALLTSWVDAFPSSLEGYLFATPRLGHYGEDSYSQAVSRACKLAGVKIIPYGGRHAAKDRVTREMGIDAARAFLGQKSVNTTNLYGTLDREHGAEVARRLG